MYDYQIWFTVLDFICHNAYIMISPAKKLLKLGMWVLILFIIVSLPAVYLNGRITIDDFKNYILSYGLMAPITFILATAVTNVIPPLAATVFWITGVILFGPFYGAVFSYVANIVGSYNQLHHRVCLGTSGRGKIGGRRVFKRN